MSIKNWTVTTESTKSARAREIYLNDPTHSNHENTENIINIAGSERTTLNIIRTCEAYKLEMAKKRKGGRPPTEAMEFCLNLPKGIRPTKEQWQKMIKGVLMDVGETLNVNVKNELLPIFRAVVHQQNQDKSKRGTGDHCHIVIGKFTPSGRYLRDLQKKGVTYCIKQSFNMQMLNVMGIDHATYIPEKRYRGHAKKRVPQWKVAAARAAEQNKRDLERIHKLENQLIEINEDTRRQNKHLDEFVVVAKEWLEAKNEGDQKRLNKLRDDLMGVSKPLKDISLPDEKLKAAQDVIDAVNDSALTNKIPPIITRRKF